MTILGKKQMSEEDIKLNFITPVIQRGWKGHITMETRITDGRINIRGNIVARSKPKFADYLLYLNDGKPIAVVEAKDNNHSVSHGLQQAMTYDMPYLSEEIIYNLRNSLLHQSTPNIEKSTIHESRCRVDKFELVITGEDGTNGDLSEVAYDKDIFLHFSQTLRFCAYFVVSCP